MAGKLPGNSQGNNRRKFVPLALEPFEVARRCRREGFRAGERRRPGRDATPMRADVAKILFCCRNGQIPRTQRALYPTFWGMSAQTNFSTMVLRRVTGISAAAVHNLG
jgi:hypothetical protein